MIRSVRVIFAAIIVFGFAECRGIAEAKLAMSPRRTAVLAEVRGTVEVKPATDKAVWVAGTASTSLEPGDIIRTGKDSAAAIRINGGVESIVAELKSESQLSIIALTADAATGRKSTMLSLKIGEVMVRTKNMNPGSNFDIATPTSIVTSRGGSSSFSVQVERLE